MLYAIDRHPPEPPPSERMLGEEPTIHPGCTIRESRIGSWTELGAGTRVEESTVCDYTYTAGEVDIIYADVGKFCSIAKHVRINPGNHPMGRVTQHHMTYRRHRFGFGPDEAAFFDWRREHRCRVGHDVWIGHGAVLMPGVSVGTGAVIGAGAVVTKDIPSYAVAVGVPARPVRLRFSEAVVASLLRIAWWDWPRERLEERFAEFLDVEHFVRRYDPALTGERA